MILNLLLNTWIMRMIFIKILMNTIQIKYVKYFLCWLIWLLIWLVTKNLIQIVTELFIWCRKINTFLDFLTQSYFAVLKQIRLNCTHYFTMKIRNRGGSQQVAINDSSDTDFKCYAKLYKKCPAKPYSFLINDTRWYLHQIILYSLNKIF